MADATPLTPGPSALARFRQWVRLAVILLASLALAFGGWLLVTSQILVSSAHQRNWQNLLVITNALESWPRDLAVSAERQYPKRGQFVAYRPPELDEVTINYTECPKPAQKVPFFEPGARPDETTRFIISRKFQTEDGTAKCFMSKMPLDRVVALERVALDFSNLLIVAPDSTVVEQVGTTSLPVTRLTELAPVSRFAAATARAAAKAVGGTDVADTGAAKAPLESNSGVASIRIADVDYFAYVRPFELVGEGQACPVTAKPNSPPAPPSGAGVSGAGAKGGAVGGQVDGTLLGEPSPGEACTFYAVGFMPAKILRQAWFRPPPGMFTGFGLALLLVLALLPLARLLLIGGAESVARFQLVAILFGMQAAAAVAMLACLFLYEISNERQGAVIDAEAAVQALAQRAGGEIGDVLRATRGCGPLAPDGKVAPPTRTPIELAGFFSQMSQNAGTRPQNATCGGAMAASTDVSRRRYFRDVERADAMQFDGHPYTIGAVRTQSAGQRRSVIAMKSQAGVLVVTTSLPSLVSPILPSPQQFLVTDGGDPALPVLFHSQPERAGVESLLAQRRETGDVLRSVAALQLESSGAGDGRPTTFTAIYDGRQTRFSAAPIAGTRWVLLVYHRLDDIDAIASSTAIRALIGWASIAVPLMAFCCVLVILRGGQRRRLWPFEAASGIYRLAAASMGLAALLEIGLTMTRAWYVLPMVVLASAGLITYWYLRLGRIRPTGDALSLETERRYRHFVLAALACVSLAPMAAFWSDARELTRDDVDASRSVAVRQSVVEWIQRAASVERQPTLPLQGADIATARIAPPVERSNFTSALWHMQSGLRPYPVRLCEAPNLQGILFCRRPGQAPAAAGNGPESIGVVHHSMPTLPSWPALMGLLLIVAGLSSLLYLAVLHGLRSLTGFGIPLNAVTWPHLVLDGEPRTGKNELPLARRTLLVAPQQMVRDAVLGRPAVIGVNLADRLLPLSDQALLTSMDASADATILPGWSDSEPGRRHCLVVTGLELVIRDNLRRRVALGYLERAAAALSDNGGTGLFRLIVIAEMSPLERILEAYEAGDANDSVKTTAREDLRWARLFQNFTTFSFAPIDKIDSDVLDHDADFADTPPNRPRRLLAEELRWLPGSVIDGAIANDDAMQTSTQSGQPIVYPLKAQDFQAFYTRKVMAWAKSINPSTEAAAIDFLRSNLIEHYEQCWASSSLAERVVLDAIARGAFVNMSKAVALQSLVRRGLVILDPAPRLMSRSFALFIRQVERPDTLERWRAAQPRSAWSAAQIPISVLLPAAIVLFAIAAVESGQDLAALTPLLAAGAPTMLGLISRSGRPMS